MSKQGDPIGIFVDTMYGSQTRETLVMLRFGDQKPWNLRTEEARRVAHDKTILLGALSRLGQGTQEVYPLGLVGSAAVAVPTSHALTSLSNGGSGQNH